MTVTPELRQWAAAAALAVSGPVPVVLVGSSSTAGLSATTAAARYANQLAARLKARHNPAAVTGGVGVAAGDTATGGGWTYSGTTVVTNSGLGYNIRQLAPGDYMERTFTGTSVTVLFKQGTGQGQLTVAIDGTPNTVTPDTGGAANRSDGTWSSPTVAAGSHTLRVTGVGTCRIEGVYCHDGDEAAGVQVWNSGLAGVTTFQLNANTSLVTRLAQLAPRLVLLMQTTNDYTSGGSVSFANTELRIRTWLTGLNAAAAVDPAVFLVHPYAPFNVSNPPATWAQYGALLEAIAGDYPNVGLVDVSAGFPTSQAADTDDLVSADGTHMTNAGHAHMADLVAAELAIRQRGTGTHAVSRQRASTAAVSGGRTSTAAVSGG